MDSRGFLGMKVLVGSSPCSFSPPLASSDLESIRKGGLLASHFLNQGRSCRAEEDDQRSTKIARSISLSSASNGEQMLSFSSSKPSSLVYGCDKASALATLPSSSAPCSQLWSAGKARQTHFLFKICVVKFWERGSCFLDPELLDSKC